jgi:hypothetical protein
MSMSAIEHQVSGQHIAKGDPSAREAITYYNPMEEREADKAPLQWRSSAGFSLHQALRGQAELAFPADVHRGLQLPALAWLIGRTINGPISGAICRGFTGMRPGISPWRCSRW